MSKIRFVGLDVHKESISIAVADSDGGEPGILATIGNDAEELIKRLRKLGAAGSVKCCYEAGPTGFSLQRKLAKAKIPCAVVAPSAIPKLPGGRVKTDRRDAIHLARCFRSEMLTPIHVPDEQTEAMRDLERAREDAKDFQRIARHQLGKFLLRHDRIYVGKTAWTEKHMTWIGEQKFAHQAQNEVLSDYVHAVEESNLRIEKLDKQIQERVEGWSLAPLVEQLQAFRGIRLLSAVVIAAEIGDFSRFGTAGSFMAYLGLVPSEHSSGASRKQGPITRTGNGHVRRILIESAWAYRFKPARSTALRKRSEQATEAVRDIAWKAQGRLNGRYKKMLGRGKNKNQTVTAIARELAGFVWAAAQTIACAEERTTN